LPDNQSLTNSNEHSTRKPLSKSSSASTAEKQANPTPNNRSSNGNQEQASDKFGGREKAQSSYDLTPSYSIKLEKQGLFNFMGALPAQDDHRKDGASSNEIPRTPLLPSSVTTSTSTNTQSLSRSKRSSILKKPSQEMGRPTRRPSSVHFSEEVDELERGKGSGKSTTLLASLVAFSVKEDQRTRQQANQQPSNILRQPNNSGVNAPVVTSSSSNFLTVAAINPARSSSSSINSNSSNRSITVKEVQAQPTNLAQIARQRPYRK
jgi:hypothetical protein